MHMTCRVWCFDMMWHMRGAGCSGDVWTTCNGHDQDEHSGVQARSWVYITDKARRGIWGARQPLGTGNGVVCLSARRKELKITRKMRAAWAGLTVLRQELFQAICDDLDTSRTLVGYYQACMKCWWSYLVRWGCAVVAARRIMEGPKCKVILLWWRSNLERSKLYLCGNQLLRDGIQLEINLSWDLLTEASYWGGRKSCGSKWTIIFRNMRWFSEKPTYSLKYRPARLRISKNI